MWFWLSPISLFMCWCKLLCIRMSDRFCSNGKLLYSGDSTMKNDCLLLQLSLILSSFFKLMTSKILQPQACSMYFPHYLQCSYGNITLWTCLLLQHFLLFCFKGFLQGLQIGNIILLCTCSFKFLCFVGSEPHHVFNKGSEILKHQRRNTIKWH